jgi:DNA-binding SARP family transcriptional activator
VPQVVQLRLLGPLEVAARDDKLAADLQWRKHLALMVYLALHPGRPRSRAHLADLLWPDGNGARSLNQALVPIRRALGEAAIRSDRDLIALDPGSVDLDTTALTDAIDGSRWLEAAALVRGPFCDGFEIAGAPQFEQWLAVQRLHWRGLMVKALLRHGAEQGDAGDYRRAAALAGRAIDLDPICEPAMLQLMQAMVLDDRQDAAVALYAAFAEQLRAETGCQPKQELVELERNLRAGPTGHPAGPVTRRAPLVGRAAQLATAREVWRRCAGERRASLLILQGDPGCGRTRLAAELTSYVRLERVAVAEARLVRSDRSPPGAALHRLIQAGLLRARGAAGAAPATLRLLQGEPDNLATLRAALADLLAAILEEQPVLLVLDDAEWCDPESLEALEALLRNLHHRPLLLLLTARQRPPLDAIDRLMARVGGDVPGAVLSLPPFTATEIGHLVRVLLPGCEPEQQERIVRRTLADSAGLPLLVTELLHAVALGLDLQDHDAPWPVPYHTLTDTLPTDLPDSVTAAIRVGYRQLDAASRQVLSAIAVRQAPMDRDAIAGLTELDAGSVDRALDALVWQRWLQPGGQGHTYVAEIARQVIERDMVTPSQRRHLTRPLPQKPT